MFFTNSVLKMLEIDKTVAHSQMRQVTLNSKQTTVSPHFIFYSRFMLFSSQLASMAVLVRLARPVD